MTTLERDKEILDLIDKIIIDAPEHYNIPVDQILKDFGLENIGYLNIGVKNGIHNLGYGVVIHKQGFFPSLVLTDLGREVKRLGGHYNYKKQIQIEETRNQLKYDAELKNLKSSTRLNAFLYKTKWLPLIISILALIISLVALLNK